MTLDEAKSLEIGQVLYHTINRNADGSPQRWRVNGAVKTWKRSPERVRVPVKHGIYAYGYLDETCLDVVETEEAKASETMSVNV